jgi:hypothetical protein
MELLRLADEMDARAEQALLEARQLTRVNTHPNLTLMQATMTPAPVKKTKGKRGPKLESKGPYATVARKLGISMGKLALLLGANDHTMRTHDQRGRVADEHREPLARLRKAPAGADMDQLAELLK